MVVFLFVGEKIVDRHFSLHYCSLDIFFFLILLLAVFWFLSGQWLWRWVFFGFFLTLWFGGLLLLDWLWLHRFFCFLLTLWLWLFGHLDLINTHTGLCGYSGRFSSGWNLDSGLLLFLDGPDWCFGLFFVGLLFDLYRDVLGLNLFGANRFTSFKLLGFLFFLEELSFSWFVGVGTTTIGVLFLNLCPLLSGSHERINLNYKRAIMG